MAHDHFTTLRSKYFSFARPVAYVARSLAFVVSVLVLASSRIRKVDMHTIQMRPNAIKIIAMQHTTVRTNVVQRFVCSHEWCTIYKGRKTSRSCLFVCCATMRLLLNMLHVIVQRFTIIFIARFISFNLPCCATSMYTMYKHLCFDHGCFGGIFSQLKRVGNGRYIYTPYESHEHSYDRTQDRTSAESPIAMAHVQSYDHLITRAILSHYLSHYLALSFYIFTLFLCV